MSGSLSYKRRDLPYLIPARTSTVRTETTRPGFPPGVQVLANTPAKKVPGTQVTGSEGHPWPPRNGGGLEDIGGNFSTSKVHLTGGSAQYRKLRRVIVTPDPPLYSTSQTYVYEGPILPFDPNSGSLPFNPWPGSVASSESSLNQAGAEAIAQCKPTNSVADAATFLGELYKDKLPSLFGSTLWRAKSDLTRNAGDEYLNYQFGWQPLVRDIRSFAEAVARAKTVLEQYERDAGRVVRRQFHFPVQDEVHDRGFVLQSAPYGPPNNNFFQDPNFTQYRVRRIDRVYKRRWFSGAFTYYLPTGYDSRKKLDKYSLFAEEILGLKLTPEVLWNLAPWSWAADWFSNIGDVISNVSDWAGGGLVLRYGYIMEHTIASSTFTHENPNLYGGGQVEPLVYVEETKLRQRANPFGFGISWDGLSPFQLSILSALGITRR